MKIKNKMNKKGLKMIGISQVLILIFGIIAVSWAIGSEVGEIGAADVGDTLEYEDFKIKITGFKDGRYSWDSLNDKTTKEFGASGTEYTNERFNELFKGFNKAVIVNPDIPPASPIPLKAGSGLSKLLGIRENPNPTTQISGPFSTTAGGGLDSLLTGLQWAGITYGAISLVGMVLPEEYQKYTDALAPSLGAGVFVGKGIHTGLQKGGFLSQGLGNKIFTFDGFLSPTAAGLVWGGLIAGAIFYFMYKDETQERVTFTCLPWEAPVGGDNCELCNKQGDLPCSEYQCRSLGQACQLLNQGSNEERCEWVNPRDVEFPTIQPNVNSLLSDYRYTPDNTISPPDRGVIIENELSTEKCVPAFTPLSFGITLNEPGRCKIDYIRTDDFESMRFFFGGNSLFAYNHTQVMSLPGPSSARAENLTIDNGGNFELFVRCMDANGNYNKANFVFKFCVEDGPDVTPPTMSLSLLSNTPVGYNQSSIPIEVYTNEPATCKWSRQDKDYDDMEERMTCSNRVSEMNARMVYTCKSTLDGLKNQQDNEFYFRCEDQPLANVNDRNQNSESTKLVLKGTRPLVIESVKPNETIKDATNSVKVTLEVKTSAGYNQGQSSCYYSETEDEDDYILFYDTDNTNGISTQDLYLGEGDYEYYIKCIDLGGNTDYDKAVFSVDVDNDPPLVLRAYHENTYLKIVTNEDAECVYDVKSCSYNFDEANPLTRDKETQHFAQWDTNKDYYIKCRDEYGNEPLPNACSISIKPFKIFSAED